MRSGTRTGDVSIALHARLRDIRPESPFGLLAEDDVNALALLVPESTLLGALDLIDFQSVTKLISTSGRSFYQVAGSSSTYLISFGSHPYPSFCPCIAFATAVLAHDQQVHCKHILACHLAEKLGRVVERLVTLDYLAAMSQDFTVQSV